MKKNIWITYGLALLLGLSLVPTTDAKGKKGKHDPSLYEKFVHKAKFFKKNAKELELSKDQVGSIKKIKLDTKKEVIQLKADIEVAALDIKSELYSQKIDVNKVNGLIDKKYGLKTKKAKTLVKAMADLKGVLSENQYEKAKEIWSSHEKTKCSKCKKRKEVLLLQKRR